MSKQIKNKKYIIGKTIDRVEDYDEKMYLFFTDGTFTIIEAGGFNDSGRYPEIKESTFILERSRYNYYELYQLGFIDKQEYEVLKSKYSQEEIENRKQEDLKKLAELKAKYETL